MPPASRIRPYKDFFTPAQHRRFALATAALFSLCYVESVIIGEWNSVLWSWFPFGRAGIRASLFFISGFLIFILRVAQLHVGQRTSISGWQTFRNFSVTSGVQTLSFYSISAWLFSEVYIWSASKGADLNRIKLMPKTDRPMLNEKPIYLTSFLFFLAFVQTGFHLFYDYDRIDMPVTKTKPRGSPNQTAHLILPPSTQLKAKLPGLMLSCFKRVVGVAVVSPILYSLNWGIYPYSLRKFAYGFTRSWAKIFWRLPKSNSLPSIAPFHYGVLLRTVTSGFMLLMLWEVGNTAFSVYAAQEPLKNERPITYESRDPNGTLLTGLKGKKLQTRAFAFWELVLIAQNYEGRRKNIFEDIDRAGGSAWTQILGTCLGVINGMELRIIEYQKPKLPANDSSARRLGVRDLALPPEPEIFPRLTQPLRDGLSKSGDIFAASPPAKTESRRAVEAVSRFAKRHGKSPTGNLKTKDFISKAEAAVFTQQQQDAIADSGITGLFRERILLCLKTSFGWPFRQEYRRRIATVVLGAPYGDVGIIVDAIDALTKFSICSLAEDKFGNVQKDLRVIIVALTKAIVSLEQFKHSLATHWTDVEAKRESPEIETILAALRGGLAALVDSFGDYATDLKLSESEMRKAREATASVA